MIALALALAGVSAGDAGAAPTVMIVALPRGARAIGVPARCAGDDAATPDPDSVCLAELYQGRAVVVRHLSGPRTAAAMTLRLTAHARRWAAGTRLLVMTRPFTDRGAAGAFAEWWEPPQADRGFCLPVDEVATLAPESLRRAFADGYRRRFKPRGFVETGDFRCVRG